jgi:putative transcriptional regulator
MAVMSFLVDKMFAVPYVPDKGPFLANNGGGMRRRGSTGTDEQRLWNHVKQHRARLDLTQEDLARRVGVRRQTILAIEKGHYAPSALLAFLLARELGMRVDELFELASGEEDRS